MPTQIHLPVSLLQSITDVLVVCGGGRNECIVYATAPKHAPDRVESFIHPTHESTPVSTTVDSTELHCVWDGLREARRKIVLQIHSHPGSAFHSSTDDNFPVIHSVGFPSLVLPSFGKRGLTGAHLAIYEGNGNWHSPRLEDWSEFLVIDDA